MYACVSKMVSLLQVFKTSYTLLPSTILLDVMTPIIFGEEYTI
jgi:hypothetical protein